MESAEDPDAPLSAAAPLVDPSAVVHRDAHLAAGVVVGPGCVVRAGVEIGEGTRLLAHVVVEGPTRLGRRNVVHPFAVLGAAPQDRSYRGEPTTLVVGDDNQIREQVTVHRGTLKGGGVTVVGSRCLLMVGVHVAHDARVGDDATLANLTTLGGHVQLGERVTTGGMVAIAPFVRVGRGAFVAGGARVERNVPPFAIAAGDRARLRAPNRVGMERLGLPEGERRAVARAYRIVLLSGAPRADALLRVERELGEWPAVRELLSWLAGASC